MREARALYRCVWVNYLMTPCPYRQQWLARLLDGLQGSVVEEAEDEAEFHQKWQAFTFTLPGFREFYMRV